MPIFESLFEGDTRAEQANTESSAGWDVLVIYLEFLEVSQQGDSWVLWGGACE